MKKSLFGWSILFLCFSASAQKLPNVQQISLRAPASIKTDGKSTEWNNKFQAYNHATEVFYTLGNDDEKLYLVIQATDPLVIRKIIAGGITFTANSSANRKDKNGVSITYPLFSKKNWPIIILKDKSIVTKDSTISSKQVDSFKNVINKRLTGLSREIKILRATALNDTLISVYNQEGIKAASLFDNQIAYTYELAVPLKYLGLSINDHLPFSYNVKLNGSNFAEGTTIEDIVGGTRVVSSAKITVPMADMQFMRYPTDFWGEYTLAKK